MNKLTLKKNKPIIFDMNEVNKIKNIETKSEKFVKSILKSINGFTPTCPVNTITKQSNKGELWYVLRMGENLSDGVETIVEMYYFDKIIFTGRGKVMKTNNTKTVFQMSLTGLKKNTNPLYFKNFQKCDDCTVILKKYKTQKIDNKDIQSYVIINKGGLKDIINEFINNYYDKNKKRIIDHILNKNVNKELEKMVERGQKNEKDTKKDVEKKLLLKYFNDDIFRKEMVEDIRCLVYYKCNIDNKIRHVKENNLDPIIKNKLMLLLDIQKKILANGPTSETIKMKNNLVNSLMNKD